MTFRGGLNDFGLVAHPACIRGYLINTFYLSRDFGIEDGPCVAVPNAIYQGYSRRRGATQYEYRAIWKTPYPYLVPREWTAYYLVHVKHPDMVETHRVRQAELEEAKMEERRRKARERYAADKPRRDRLAALKKVVSGEAFSSFVASGIARRVCPIYFESNKTECPITLDQARGMTEAAHRLLPFVSEYQLRREVETDPSLGHMLTKLDGWKSPLSRLAESSGLSESTLEAVFHGHPLVYCDTRLFDASPFVLDDAYCKQQLVRLGSLAEHARRHLHFGLKVEDLRRLRREHFAMTSPDVCRLIAREVLAGMAEKVVGPSYKPVLGKRRKSTALNACIGGGGICNNPPAKQCSNGMCGRCCDGNGCERHAHKRARI
jgi:hypothetical protein